MLLKRISFILFLTTLLILPSCKNGSPPKSNDVVIGISADAESLNPLFTYTVDEGNISELLYLSLMKYEWEPSTGTLKPEPMLAKSWQWSKDSTSITFNLRKDVYWSDGKQLTAGDVIFSYDVYSDPVVQSRLFGTFNDLYSDTSQRIDLKKSVKVENPFEFTVYFKKNSVPDLNSINIPVIPEHVFKNIKRKNLITAEKDKNSVFDGPFVLKKWNKNQAIILEANKKSFLYKKENVEKVIFKIIPDYNSRLTQLKKGEIDLMEDIKADDYNQLEKDKSLKIVPIKGREYDYVGWNNIDPDYYAKNKKAKPNKLFGSVKVREALTLAINRNEILHEYLNDHGSIADGPVAPIFKSALNTEINPLPYNPEKAKKLLAQAGWKDENKDGVLEKGNQTFSFTLYIPSGNPRREFAATVIQNNLRIVGVDVKIQSLEPEVFFGKMFDRKFNAWMAGWSVAIPLDLKPYWYSDLENTPLNIVSYQNKKADILLNKIINEKSAKVKDELTKKFQQVLFNDHPETFLYWIDNIVAYNKRIKNINITPLGAVIHCWNWSVKQ